MSAFALRVKSISENPDFPSMRTQKEPRNKTFELGNCFGRGDVGQIKASRPIRERITVQIS